MRKRKSSCEITFKLIQRYQLCSRLNHQKGGAARGYFWSRANDSYCKPRWSNEASEEKRVLLYTSTYSKSCGPPRQWWSWSLICIGWLSNRTIISSFHRNPLKTVRFGRLALCLFEPAPRTCSSSCASDPVIPSLSSWVQKTRLWPRQLFWNSFNHAAGPCVR